MPLFYRALADVVVVLHLGYVAFVVGGQLLILAGVLRGWQWIRDRRFRTLHLTAIAVVVAESLLEITCPLTTLEQHLRTIAGQATYRGDFIGNCAHELLFFDCAPQTFTAIYTLFGLLVIITFLLAPPRRKPRPHP